MRVLLIKSCRRSSENAFLESYGQHSKQTSLPEFESLPPRSKAGGDVPAQPGRQPCCPKSSKFPSLTAMRLIQEKLCACHGLEQGRSLLIPSLSLAVGCSRARTGKLGHLIPSCCRSILRALAATGKALGSQEIWMLGKPKKIPNFVELWPVPLETKALYSPGQRVIRGELLLPWPQHPPLPRGEDGTQKCSTEELCTVAP